MPLATQANNIPVTGDGLQCRAYDDKPVGGGQMFDIGEPMTSWGLHGRVPKPCTSPGVPDDTRDGFPLRRQAQQIIDSVLAGSDSRQAGVRARLCRCVDANPGRPERALLEHLRVERALTADE